MQPKNLNQEAEHDRILLVLAEKLSISTLQMQYWQTSVSVQIVLHQINFLHSIGEGEEAKAEGSMQLHWWGAFSVSAHKWEANNLRMNGH